MVLLHQVCDGNTVCECNLPQRIPCFHRASGGARKGDGWTGVRVNRGSCFYSDNATNAVSDVLRQWIMVYSHALFVKLVQPCASHRFHLAQSLPFPMFMTGMSSHVAFWTGLVRILGRQPYTADVPPQKTNIFVDIANDVRFLV